MANSPYRSRFGDTTLTKVFVGGLAWETPTEELRRYFEQFGEILEAVIITDKNTKRSKGYGFVTFRDADSATRACMESNPIIDGRKANCNIASRPNPSTGGRSQGGPQRAPPTQFTRPPSHIHPSSPPPPPPPLHYPPYGYMTYPADYGYQHAFYNSQLPPQYHQHIYGPTSPSRVGPSYSYTPAIGVGYTMQTSPTGQFSMTQHSYNRMRVPPPPRPPPPPPPPYNVRYTPQFVPSDKGPPTIQSSSHEHGFQLQPPPTRQNLITSETQHGDMQLQQEQQHQPSTAGDATETSHDS